MSLTLRILAPDKNVFDETVEEVILPSTTGLLGILPGHISMVTAIGIGVLKVRKSNGSWNSIALMGGFAEVDSNDVTVLVNSAELSENIDRKIVEVELEEAKKDLSKFEGEANSPNKMKAQENLEKARAKFQASIG